MSTRGTPAVRLLDRVLETSKMDREALAESLGVSGSELEAFRSGARRISAELRLRLASLVVAHVPEYARAAQRVKQEADAEVAFRNTTTVTHLSAPPSRFGS
jgi:plasmid maintenance system antidote protein VapI